MRSASSAPAAALREAVLGRRRDGCDHGRRRRDARSALSGRGQGDQRRRYPCELQRARSDRRRRRGCVRRTPQRARRQLKARHPAKVSAPFPPLAHGAGGCCRRGGALEKVVVKLPRVSGRNVDSEAERAVPKELLSPPGRRGPSAGSRRSGHGRERRDPRDEIGPGKVLAGLCKRIARDPKMVSVGDLAAVHALAPSGAGTEPETRRESHVRSNGKVARHRRLRAASACAARRSKPSTARP